MVHFSCLPLTISHLEGLNRQRLVQNFSANLDPSIVIELMLLVSPEE